MRRTLHHLTVFTLYIILTIAVMYPTIRHLNDAGWLADAVNDPDAYIKLWDVWYLDKLLAGESAFYHTDWLFAPEGLDLTYHTFNLPHMLTVHALKPFFGLLGAFNLTAMLVVIVTAFSGYLLILEVLQDLNLTPKSPLQVERGLQGNSSLPIQIENIVPNSPSPPLLMERGQGGEVFAAFFGGCVFGLSQWVVHNVRHPDLALLATFALALLCFIKAIRRRSSVWGIGAGILWGITAYIGMYIVVIMGMIFAAVALVHLRTVWKQPRFYAAMVLCGIFFVAVAAPRIAPMMQGNLKFVLEDKYTRYNQWESIDLVNFFVPDAHPSFGQAFALPQPAQRYHMFYLGWLPLGLILVGIVRRATRRAALFWGGLALFFMLLGMGTILNINGVMYPAVPMPKRYLDALPVLFKSFGRPDNFQVGVVLPFAIAAAYGFKSIFNHGGTGAPCDSASSTEISRRKSIFVGFIGICVISLTLFELYTGEYKGRDVLATVSPFYEQIAQEEGDFALIQLPIGRNPSKPYLLYQIVHDKPIVEGLASRTPAGAYEYINANPLLNAWNTRAEFDCAAFDMSAAVDQLLNDGFRYVIIQKGLQSTPIYKAYFAGQTPVYEDAGMVVYDLKTEFSCP